eukprot:TRINITY_DN5406_c1_g1_i1.p1 TRINITY_DN5406_c1_g1~~TRINITY_DN5406_c1_g1_i1.p1  ORF type:complete len:452 (-),score=49.54 TRINITY_DN5406_c1_g1_i1:799-2154(-)
MTLWLHGSHIAEDLSLQPLTLNKNPEKNARVAGRLASLRRHARRASSSLDEAPTSTFRVHVEAPDLCVRDGTGAECFRLPLLFSQIAGSPLGSGQLANAVGVIAYSGPFFDDAAALGRGDAGERVASGSMWLMVVRESNLPNESAGIGASPRMAVLGVMDMLGFHGAVRGESSGLHLEGPTLGFGNSSTVLALRRETGNTVDNPVVAAKHISAYVDAADVLNEVSVLMRVRGHPNVAAILGVFAEETDPGVDEWMLMTPVYSQGCVHDLIEREGPFASGRFWGFMDNLLSAVCHIHSCNIVHCDITTVNVLIDRDGRAVLIDLGIAVEVPETASVTSRQGTPGFVAPEILVASICTHKADVFSCGAVGYYVLYGSLPFAGDTVNRVLRRNAMVDLRFPSAACSRAVGLMMTLLDPDPNGRLSSRDALARVRTLAQETPESLIRLDDDGDHD